MDCRTLFDQVEEAVGHAAMADTLGTAWIAIQCYALSAIAIAVLQGAGFTKHAFWIELTSVTVYIAVAYVLALEWTAPIHVIWRADWVYFGGILLGSAACLKIRALARRPSFAARFLKGLLDLCKA